MSNYRAKTYVPPLVKQAIELSDQLEFKASSIIEVGRLLQLLASQFREGIVAEIGTGCGVGAAWIISGLRTGATFVTVELDPQRAAATKSLFASCSNVQVICKDWHEILKYAPFSLLFVDGGKAKQYEPELLVDALEIGGLIVLDDLTPEDQWPLELLTQPDPIRKFWLNEPRLNAVELLVTPTNVVIMATRIK